MLVNPYFEQSEPAQLYGREYIEKEVTLYGEPEFVEVNVGYTKDNCLRHSQEQSCTFGLDPLHIV